MKSGQNYLTMTGGDLLQDNGSGYSLLCGSGNEPYRAVRRRTVYVVGFNGVRPDHSTLNHVEPLSSCSRKWLKKHAPQCL